LGAERLVLLRRLSAGERTVGTAPETPDNGRPVVSSNSRWNPSGESVTSTLGGSTNGHSDTEHFLHLLVGGRIPSADLEFLSNERITAVLDELASEFDVVFVDSPPLLAVGDAMALSTKVDAIVVIAEFGIKRPLLKELARELENCQAPRIGFIVTGVSEEDGYGYGYGAESAHGATSTKRTRQRVSVTGRTERQPRQR
jgi:Mrp family chromosome partitioning ATPase